MVAMFGRIMPAPLETGNRHFFAVDRNNPRRRLGDGVGGHDAVRGGMPVICLEIGLRRRQSGLDAVDRQKLENNAGRKR
jgi:hypothetical protein